MIRAWTINQISCRFYQFAGSIGYVQKQQIGERMFTQLYAIGNHAISLEIDWRDYYLDLFVIRMTDGVLPKSGALTQDGCLCRIPVRNIYHVEPADYPGEDRRSSEALLYRLEALIAIVQENVGILEEFIENIHIYTSKEATKRYFRSAFERRLALMDEEYALGKMDEKTYAVLRRSLVLQLEALNKK